MAVSFPLQALQVAQVEIIALRFTPEHADQLGCTCRVGRVGRERGGAGEGVGNVVEEKDNEQGKEDYGSAATGSPFSPASRALRRRGGQCVPRSRPRAAPRGPPPSRAVPHRPARTETINHPALIQSYVRAIYDYEGLLSSCAYCCSYCRC